MNEAKKTQERRATIRTVLTYGTFVVALIANWRPGLGRLTANVAAMLWAKMMAETSNIHVYAWNLTNVRSFPGDGFDYVCLNGPFEGFKKAAADLLVASGQAVYETNEERIAAVAPLTCVRYVPPHRHTRFRAYDSLDQAMAAYLELLEERYIDAVHAAREGEIHSFAAALARAGYMTANVTSYVKAMTPHFAPARRNPEIAAIDLEEVDPNEITIVPDHGTHAIDYSRALREEMLRERYA